LRNGFEAFEGFTVKQNAMTEAVPLEGTLKNLYRTTIAN
jgi:hypothetical protein